jgi:hypothetical protein
MSPSLDILQFVWETSLLHSRTLLNRLIDLSTILVVVGLVLEYGSALFWQPRKKKKYLALQAQLRGWVIPPEYELSDNWLREKVKKEEDELDKKKAKSKGK